LDKVIAEIKQTYLAAQENLEKLPRDRLDRTWVLEDADFAADSIYDWVAQNTRWVPYRGVLRGSDGVLLDRRGNSLDRSLLLGALLEEAGYDVRLVHGELSTSAVAQLLNQMDTGQYNAKTVDSYVDEQARAVVGRAAQQSAKLASMVNLPIDPWSAGIEQAIADHWWVEANIDSDWRVLDLQINGSLEGLRPEAVTRFATDKLPDLLFQSVTARIVFERWNKHTLTEEVPLEYSFKVADGRYHDLELQFLPFGNEVPSAEGDAMAEGLSLADTTQEWLPMIRDGDARFQDLGFDVAGHLERNLGRLAVHRNMASATEALGGLSRKTENPPEVLSACWIEYEINVPGRDPEIVRREIFDLIGADRRGIGDIAGFSLETQGARARGLALAGVTRILVTGAQIPPVALKKASLDLWARQGPQIAAFARLIVDPNAEEPLQRLHKEPLISLDLIAFAVMREELSRHRAAIYQGRPNIFTTHYVPAIGDDLAVFRSIDIVSNEVGIVSSGSGSAARIRLEQGVLDTVLENAMSPAGGIPNNTSDLFSRGESAARGWSVVDNGSENSLLPASTRARISGAMAIARTVVAPEWVAGGYAPAWWEIDPATGTTLGIGNKGWGQASEEAPLQTIAAGGVREGTRKVGVRVACAQVLAFLEVSGMTIRWLPGPSGPVPILTPHLLTWLASYGCAP
jgi:hypothetical protein